MQNLCEQITCILDRCLVHSDLNIDRTSINVVRIGISISRTLSYRAKLPFAFVFIDDAFKAFTFGLEFTA